jgi:hypothetical protein
LASCRLLGIRVPWWYSEFGKGRIIRHYLAEFQAQIHPAAEAQYICGMLQIPV